MTATNRRRLLGRVAFAGATGVLATSAPLASTGRDPHPEWEREAKRLQAAVDAAFEADNEPQAAALNAARWTFLDRIAHMPAATPAGLAVQLRYVIDYIDDEPLDVVCRVASTLDRLGFGSIAS